MRTLIASLGRKDFRVDTFRSGGPGGQNQNKRDSGVRITHLETGLVGESREYKEQGRNRVAAFTRLGKLIKAYYQQVIKVNHEKSDETVRTYHAVENRVKDHASGVMCGFDAALDSDAIDQLIIERHKQCSTM